MAGYGNKTAADPNFDDGETNFSHLANSHSYQGGHPERGSGTTGGAGWGNKSAPESNLDEYDDGGARYGDKLTNAPYSGGHPENGSGSTGGVGWGNKTSSGFGDDSRAGMLLEKIGETIHKPSLSDKGKALREKKRTATEPRAEQGMMDEAEEDGEPHKYPF